MKNSFIKLTLLILASSIGVSAQKANRPESQKPTAIIVHNLDDKAVPLFVFTYLNPWRKIYGSDMPEFVLYQDGTVFFTKCREKDNPYSCEYRMAKLSVQETSQMMNKLLPEAFYSLKPRYFPGGSITVSDLAERVFVMRKPDGTYKEVSTYGALSGNKPGYAADNVPDTLREIVEFVTSYDNLNATEFGVDYCELVIEPYDGDSNKNLKWPKDMPDLKDSKNIKHKEYGRYSLFIKWAQYKKLRDITYKQWKSKAAILINNQRWDAEIRTPFPSEAIWLGNFRD